MIYLDYQATTPLAPEALDAMLPWLRDQHANPHSAHAEGRRAKAAVEAAREEIASMLPPGGRLAFTSGATEALNWAIKGIGPDATVVALATEHAAVLDTVRARRTGEGAILGVDVEGLSDPAQLGALFTRPAEVRLLAAMLVNNEIGVIHPIADLAAAAHSAGAVLLCDAVQGFGRVPIPEGCDMIAISAHKIHGPKGIGALWVRDGIELEPLLHGGKQEFLGRSGTLSPALCAGFAAAAKLMREREEEDRAHVERLWRLATEVLSDEWLLNGSAEQRYHGNLNLRCEGIDASRVISEARQVAFSAGSACASGSGRTSHVLAAIGLSERQARGSVRLGFGRYTSEDEFVRGLNLIRDAAARQRAWA